MRAARASDEVFVETSARLHFGVLDLGGSLGRWFGGIGAAAPGPTLLVSARPADMLGADGEDADRALEFARRFQDHHPGFPTSVHLRIHRALPEHAGLGSGTQLGLAVARLMAEIAGVSTDTGELACAIGRAKRSAIGTWTFAGGGFVLEGGRRPERDSVAPLLARLPFPKTWRCVVAVPDSRGISGPDEAAAFAALPPAPERDVERVAHLVLMGLLPALVDGDIATFGSALSAIQTITGRWFAPVQGGAFASGASEDLVRRMPGWGAAGVGQSSWGPTVYGIVDGEAAGLHLADRVRDAMNGAGSVHEGPFRTEGARVWRGGVHD